MSLNNTTADALAQTIVTNLGAANSSLSQWQTICRAFFASLTANGTVTIEAASIVTVGSATTQTGPSSPIILPLE